MSKEITSSTIGVPKIASNECIAEYLDERILGHIAGYVVRVAGTEKHSQFLKVPEDNRADYVCSMLGANPDHFEEATELQSLRALRRLHRNAEDGVRGQAGGISVPALGAFWHTVDRTMHWQIGAFVQKEAGLEIPNYDSLLPSTPSRLCVIAGYAIERTEIPDRFAVMYTAEAVDESA